MALDPRIQIEVDVAVTQFKLGESAMKVMLRTATGVDIAQRAIRVERQAKLNASHSRPSVPGSGPAVRTGRLRGSISWRLGEDHLGVYADVGSNVEYAPYVELGTSRMAARPFLRPALAAAR